MASMRSTGCWKRVSLACALALTGCNASGSSELQVVAPEGCSASDNAVAYRLTALHVPTRADVDAGAPLGHDLDGVEGACDVPDYAWSVDNTLVDLAHALPLLAPDDPFVLQDELDEALFCTAADAGCTPQWVGVRIQECRRGVKVDVFRVTDGACTAIGTADRAGLGRDGQLQAEFSNLALDGAIDGRSDAAVLFSWVNARLTATVTDDGLEDAVLGGMLPFEVFEAAATELADCNPAFEDCGPLIGLYDIMLEPDGACDGLSMGVTLSAVEDASGESCE